MDEQQFLLPGHSRGTYGKPDDDSDEEWTGDSSSNSASSFYTDSDRYNRQMHKSCGNKAASSNN